MKKKQLTVYELIEALNKLPPDASVFMYGTEVEAEVTGVLLLCENEVLIEGVAYHGREV